MKVSDALKKLAARFPSPLYVVGGAVRDSLLGSYGKDIDLAAALAPDEVASALKGTEFKVFPTSPKLGTLKIRGGGEEYEYTAFRTDSYACDGTHAPKSVRFTKDLREDALRRDFTADAVYYDITKGNYLDPLGGIEDIAQKKLRAVRDPREVLCEDGLRLMRMVRIAASCGFEVEQNLYAACKEQAELLQNIHKSRIGAEFAKLVVCDTENGIKGAHVRAIEMLIDLGLMRFILPELLEGKDFLQRADFHKYDVLGHILKVFELSPARIRLAALFHDISKPSQKLKTGKMAGHEFAGAVVLRQRLTELCFAKEVVERNARLVMAHMVDLKCETKENKLKLFIQRNADILEDLIALKNADYEGSGMKQGDNPSSVRLKNLYDQMKRDGVPFCTKELKVGGADLIQLGIPAAQRGKVLQELLETATREKKLLTREGQYAFLEKKAIYLKTL